MPRLLVNPGTPHQWEITLKAGTNTLGRSPDCDAQIDHGSVSSNHCQVVVNGDSVTIRDLGSTNGTFLNRAPIREGVLAAGVHLQIGSVDMELLADTPVQSNAPVSIRLARSEEPRSAVAIASSAPADPTAPSIGSNPPRLGLRVVATESHAPAAPPPPPPVTVADEYAEQPVGGPAMCKYHPKSVARYLCNHCHLTYCELCVTSRSGGTQSGKYCRRCSNECIGLNVQLIAPNADKENFFTNIHRAFAYPVKGSGLVFLILGTFFFALVDFLGTYSFYLRIVYIGYTFAYVQRVIQTAAQGSDEAAGWPDISDFWGDIFVPFFQTLGLIAVSFGPAIGLGFWIGWESMDAGNVDPQKMVLLVAAVILGALYYPMAFLALAMFDSVVSANPLVVIPAIIRVPLEYLTILVVTGLIFVVKVAQGVLTSLLAISVIPDLIAAGIGLYLLTVQGRLLGLMYFSKRHKLGWFSR